MTPDQLLTDQFVEFSQKIADIHAKKKAAKQKLRNFYDEIQSELLALDQMARDAKAEFDEWVKTSEATDS